MAKQSQIKAVAFDLGGVLIAVSQTERFEYWGEQLGLSAEQVADAWDTCSPELERGEITMQEFWQKIEQHLNRQLDANLRPNLWGHPMLTSSGARPELLRLVDQLQAVGIKVGLLSNIYIERADIARHNAFFDRFDAVCLSSQMHAIKPEPEAYRILLERLGVEASECVFVDDIERNVVGAEAVRIHGIVFESSQQLMNDLSKLGVKVN